MIKDHKESQETKGPMDPQDLRVMTASLDQLESRENKENQEMMGLWDVVEIKEKRESGAKTVHRVQTVLLVVPETKENLVNPPSKFFGQDSKESPEKLVHKVIVISYFTKRRVNLALNDVILPFLFCCKRYKFNGRESDVKL